MVVFAIRVEHPLNVAVQRPHDADPLLHQQRAIYFRLAEISVGQLIWQLGGWCRTADTQIVNPIRVTTVTASFARISSPKAVALLSRLRFLPSARHLDQPVIARRQASPVLRPKRAMRLPSS
jgi:hypothetical protein